MRKPFSSWIAILLIILPVVVSMIWHINNNGWPNDDPANYMTTAYQQYLTFQEGSPLDGLKSLYQIRDWRPTLFPVLATPFLLLFKGNILAATGATLVICLLICQIYIYAIAKHYLDSLRASLVASFTGSCPVMIFHSTTFFSEIAWLAFFTGFVFHVLNSENFRRPFQATIAGILLGLAMLIRPAETFAITIFLLAGMIIIGLVKKVFLFNSAVRVVIFMIVSLCLLIASIIFRQVDYRVILVIGTIIVILQMIIKTNKEKEPGFSGFNFFAISIVVINLLWWADSMPHLYCWIYNASLGMLSKITDAPVNWKQIFLMYLFPQGALAAVLCLALLLPDPKRTFNSIKRLGPLSMITLGLLFPMFIMYAITNTGDSRRIIIGMIFLLLLISILSLQDGSLKKTRTVLISLTLAFQLTLFSFIAIGHPLLTKYFEHMMPRKNQDQNEAVILHLLELGVPGNSAVAVYTATLYQAKDRIYEPHAMQLAALTCGSKFRIIYFWDIGAYHEVMKRLQEDEVQFLLIDIYRDIENQGHDKPYVQFANSLLDKMEDANIDPPGLKRLASFNVNGREQVLYKILPVNIFNELNQSN